MTQGTVVVRTTTDVTSTVPSQVVLLPHSVTVYMDVVNVVLVMRAAMFAAFTSRPRPGKRQSSFRC